MVNLCPNCKNSELKENISFDGALFWVKKILTIYCPSCDYQNIKIFKSSLSEKQNYEMRRL